ncbi:GMC family oxidoreductase [Tunturibacter psychrotolerans]|uniref:GMC family oxidoreductase n=1 Tax=Tunturiibacter psychrotolerans TaxID=3069686 RepID=A0AAU7ZW29_9BACT
MAHQTRYDIIIIGTGAGGATLAKRLAPSGMKILILERGDYVPREKENWSSLEVNLKGHYLAKEKWRTKDGEVLEPHTNYNVGGNTKFFGAALFRLREVDFGEIRHEAGVSPAWPISYKDLESYYDEAEDLFEVRGERGVDPTDPPTTGPYPFPAISHEERLERLSADFSSMGLHPFHTPLGVRLDEQHRRTSRCIRCNTCDGFPCLIHAKSDAEMMCIEPTLRMYDNVTLLTKAKVASLKTGASGKEITGVLFEHDGEQVEMSADVVVVSCGAINSAALLLRSANNDHPNGLANRSGVVGRHYMGHTNSVVMALSLCPNPTTFQKTLSVNDFYQASSEWEYPMGHISFVGKLDLDTLKAGAPAIAPGWSLELMAKHSLDFWLTSEDLPDPENRVTINRAGEIVLSYTPNNLEAHKRLKHQLSKMMKITSCELHGSGCHQGLFDRNIFIGQQIPLAGVAHQNGTVRFGHDPLTSALDINCKAHDVDNLYVVDGSFFPSSGAVNPALTIVANALRVGDHLLERMHARKEVSKALQA